MSDKEKMEPLKEKPPLDLWNLIVGYEFIVAIVVLLLSAAGYVILK